MGLPKKYKTSDDLRIFFIQSYSSLHAALHLSQRRIQGGGLWGLSLSGPLKSIDFRGFSGPNVSWAPPPGKNKNVSSPWTIIPESAPDLYLLFIL